MKSGQIKSLTPAQIQDIRKRWLGDSSFIGFPDAERDTAQDSWFDNLLVQPDWFSNATSTTVTVAVARKGAGKSAVRLTSIERRKSDSKILIVEASADELASLHAERLAKAAERGYGAVSDWMQIYADLICRRLAHEMSGRLLTYQRRRNRRACLGENQGNYRTRFWRAHSRCSEDNRTLG